MTRLHVYCIILSGLFLPVPATSKPLVVRFGMPRNLKKLAARSGMFLEKGNLLRRYFEHKLARYKVRILVEDFRDELDFLKNGLLRKQNPVQFGLYWDEIEFMFLCHRTPLVPLAAIERIDGSRMDQICIVVRRDSPCRRLEDLAGKPVLMRRFGSRLKYKSEEYLFVEQYLKTRGKNIDSFFSQRYDIPKADFIVVESEPLLMVLARAHNVAGCITYKRNHTFLKVLNPRAAAGLRVIKMGFAKPMLTPIFCTRAFQQAHPALVRSLQTIMGNMHQPDDETGNMILTFNLTRRMLPIMPAQRHRYRFNRLFRFYMQHDPLFVRLIRKPLQ